MLWPPPAVGQGSAAGDNPWLTGEALAPPSASGGHGEDPSTGGSGPSATGGAAAGSAPGSSPAGVGGSSSSPPASEDEPGRLRLRAYVESAGSFKGLLIEHVAGGPSGVCSVELYSNGNVEVWRSLDVPPGLTLGERALLCVPEGASPSCSVHFGGSVYNGNDALALTCDGQVQDIIGAIGVDPGKGWSGVGYDGAPISTVDAGLWRCDFGAELSAFDPAEWRSWDWAADASWTGPSCLREEGWGGAPLGP